MLVLLNYSPVVTLEKNLQSLGTSRDTAELRQSLWVTPPSGSVEPWHLSMCSKKKCLFALCFITLFHIDYSFLVELPAITRFNTDDKVANLRWLHLFKMHYIPLCRLACHQFYRTFFMIALETYWQCSAAFIFNFPFSFSRIDAGCKQHIERLWLMQIITSVVLCVSQQFAVFGKNAPENTQENT